jgi:ATP-dependent Zn protease
MVAYDSEQKIDYTKAYWFCRTCVALAGRAAQVKQFAEDGLDNGASSDLRQAMWSAWMAIAKYGMHSESYNMDVTALKEWTGDTYFKAHTEALIKAWINDATVTTEKLVSEHWQQIEQVAKALLEHEVLSEQDFITLLQ